MIEIRSATPGDADGISDVHLAAFETSLEADLVERLGDDGDVVISMVAVDDELIVGHVLFSRMSAEADGRSLAALGLAPVAVRPERQGQGIGSMLIEAGLREASSNGTEIVFLLGDPNYYCRFGFAAEIAAPFASPYAGEYFQARVLGDNFAAPASGRADYAAAFADLE